MFTFSADHPSKQFKHIYIHMLLLLLLFWN